MKASEKIGRDLQYKNENGSLLIEYLYILALLLSAAHANIFFHFSFPSNPLMFLILAIFSGILAIKWRIPFNKEFYLLIFCYLIYFAATCIKYKEIHLTVFIYYSVLFFVSYVAVKSLKYNLFRIFEDLLLYLAIFGLCFWIIQIILGGNNLYNIFSAVPFIARDSYVTGQGMNAILYSVQPTSMSILYDFLPPRNCGFAWEPGGFAVFLCLAIFINLFFKNTNGNRKLRFWILVAALLSTQSTTGYSIFIVIVMFYYFNKKLNIIILLLPVFLAVMIFVLSLPFMREKIISLVSETQEIDIMIEGTIGTDSSIAPQRFTSFIIAFRDFLDNPLLGLGGNVEESWTSRIGASVSTISGIGNLLAQFGIIGFIFFIVFSFKSSVSFSKYNNYNGSVLFLVILVLMSISYGIILYPMIMSFWMFSLIEPRNTILKET